ncbi:tautomerase [Halospeciosus flavus]|uniref:Tautomerase n=1 Tax=Halospeciosus flavus TaxID=3032283 RepID=A0ABD5Z1U2_9EURY|nr:tautomerase [Halospeciosus flavus]
MPHLQFETTVDLDDDETAPFTDWVTELYAHVMDTGTDHVAVTVRNHPAAALSLGRAGPDEPVAVVNADVRAGRSADQRRELAESLVGELDARFGVPTANCYVVYTEHPGEDFHLAEGPLASWDHDEDDPTE